MMHNALMIKKKAALLSLASVPVMLSQGDAKTGLFQCKGCCLVQHHNCKPKSHK
jgi:hypothetical protein